MRHPFGQGLSAFAVSSACCCPEGEGENDSSWSKTIASYPQLTMTVHLGNRPSEKGFGVVLQCKALRIEYP